MSDYKRPMEVAEYLNISRATLYRWVDELEDFPTPYRIGGGTSVWDIKEIEAYVKSKKVKKGAEDERD